MSGDRERRGGRRRGRVEDVHAAAGALDEEVVDERPVGAHRMARTPAGARRRSSSRRSGTSRRRLSPKRRGSSERATSWTPVRACRRASRHRPGRRACPRARGVGRRPSRSPRGPARARRWGRRARGRRPRASGARRGTQLGVGDGVDDAADEVCRFRGELAVLARNGTMRTDGRCPSSSATRSVRSPAQVTTRSAATVPWLVSTTTSRGPSWPPTTSVPGRRSTPAAPRRSTSAAQTPG